MRGSTAGVVALCVCCLLGLGLLAGAIQSPTTAAGTYEVALPAEDVLSVSEPTVRSGRSAGRPPAETAAPLASAAPHFSGPPPGWSSSASGPSSSSGS